MRVAASTRPPSSRAATKFWSSRGEGLTIGRDSGDAVSKEYTPTFAFTGGSIREVEMAVGDDVYVDLERDFHVGLARD